MKVPDPRGVGVWQKRLPELTEAQARVRDAFAARWLEVVASLQLHRAVQSDVSAREPAVRQDARDRSGPR